jgi:lipid-binding SYLF domain-containing protein
MKKNDAARIALVALLAGVAGFSSPSWAETGQVAVVFTKGGFIIGVGGGEGVLLLRGKRYPFTVSGMSVGFTIGASTTKFVGRALNLSGPKIGAEVSAAVGGVTIRLK